MSGFLSFQTCRNKVRLDPLKFRRIFPHSKTCDSKSKATDIGLLREETNSPRAKIQTCKFPLGQYAKFQTTFKSCRVHFDVFFSDNLSRNSCMRIFPG